MGLSLHKLDMASAFYDRHGRKTVFICRFIPVIRGIASLPAGISRMRKRYFFPYTMAGSGIFCFALAFLGLAFSKHFDDLAPYVHKLSLGIVALGVMAVAFVIVRLKERRAEG
jgi:membrane protein DedA with SNARE-associated domain